MMRELLWEMSDEHVGAGMDARLTAAYFDILTRVATPPSLVLRLISCLSPHRIPNFSSHPSPPLID